MKLLKNDILMLISALGFSRQDSPEEVYFKAFSSHNEYILKVDFENERIEYGSLIKLGDKTTSNFENSENFVVLECVVRLLEKGYPPERIELEHKWPVGRREKGKLDIFISDISGRAYLMIECKTWGDEYQKERKKMLSNGAQLFSYFQQDKSCKYLCLYSSRFHTDHIEYLNDIVVVDSNWSSLGNQKEIFEQWNKSFKDNGIFDEWAQPYDIEIKSLTRGRLKAITADDSGWIFNQFAEILRHNVVSDKPNAFNKIFNLFLCKIVDEDRSPSEEVEFQWKANDTFEILQKRLSDLYKKGMKEYLTKDVTDYNDAEINEKLYALDDEVREQIKDMFTRVRLHKNNEFAFKEVFDEKSFKENAIVVKEVVELLQPYQIKYQQKHQFLGDFFELLLSTGIKQEAGQFFTPVPIAKYIVSSLPIRELILAKINSGSSNFLPYVIDYAAGSGHFLTEVMDEINGIISSIDLDSLKPSIKGHMSSWRVNQFQWADEYVYGIEADYRLVKTAKVSCFLNGDGLAKVIHASGLDPFGNSPEYIGKLSISSDSDPMDNCQFDILVTNPPYSVSAFKNTLNSGATSFSLFNSLTEESSEIECLFIERMKQLLIPGGFAGIVLPTSILNNSGIYSRARDIILKYFEIVAITEFGSNTFMATGFSTVALFLKRRKNNHWKEIKSKIDRFFSSLRDSMINNIENPISKYVDFVYKNLNFQDYISLVQKSPNLNVQQHSIYIEYKSFFSALPETIRLSKSKAFKSLSTAEQSQILDDKFFEFVFQNEIEKILNFILLLDHRSVIIKTGKKQAEKEFLGYEFSGRRGNEGIKFLKDENGNPSTRLYDEHNSLNPRKANSYIYSAFLNSYPDVDPSLSDNISSPNTLDLFDFSRVPFDNSISLIIREKKNYALIWGTDNLVRLSSIADIFKGTSITKKETTPGNIPVVAGGKKAAYYHNVSNRQGNVITVSASGANAGFLNYWADPIFASDCNTICSKDESVIPTKLIYYFLQKIQNHIFDFSRGSAQGHVYDTDLSLIEIPLPSPENQLIILNKMDETERKINEHNSQLQVLLADSGNVDSLKALYS